MKRHFFVIMISMLLISAQCQPGTFAYHEGKQQNELVCNLCPRGTYGVSFQIFSKFKFYKNPLQ